MRTTRSALARVIRLIAMFGWLGFIWLGATVMTIEGLARRFHAPLIQRAGHWVAVEMSTPSGAIVPFSIFAVIVVAVIGMKILEWLKVISPQRGLPSTRAERILGVIGGVGLLIPVFTFPLKVPKALTFDEIFPPVFIIVYSLFIVVMTIRLCLHSEESERPSGR